MEDKTDVKEDETEIKKDPEPEAASMNDPNKINKKVNNSIFQFNSI